MPSDFITRYQAKMDREFPRGAVAFWQGKDDVAYLVPRILVTGQRGLDPEIWLPVFDGSNKTLGPFRVLSLQEDLGAPGDLRLVRMAIDGVDRELHLSAGVSETTARAMAADRQMFTDLAPHGGPRVFDGDAPE